MKKLAADIRLLAAQDDKMGWWNALSSPSSLRQWDLLPECEFQGAGDIWEVRKEETVALAKAL